MKIRFHRRSVHGCMRITIRCLSCVTACQNRQTRSSECTCITISLPKKKSVETTTSIRKLPCIILLCPPVFSESWHVTSAIWMKHINISHSLQEWISMITTTTSTRESMPPTWQEPGRRSLMDSQVCVVRMVC